MFSPAPRDQPTHRVNFVLSSHPQCFLRSQAPPHMLPNMLHLKSLNLPLQLHHLAAQPWTPLAALWAAPLGAALQAAEPAEEHVGRPKGDQSAREAPGKMFGRPVRRAVDTICGEVDRNVLVVHMVACSKACKKHTFLTFQDVLILRS